MVPIELPVLGNLACRLLVEVLVRAAGVKELSVPVPVPWRSAPAVVPHAEIKHKVLSPIPKVVHQLEGSPLVAVYSGDRTLSLDLGWFVPAGRNYTPRIFESNAQIAGLNHNTGQQRPGSSGCWRIMHLACWLDL